MFGAEEQIQVRIVVSVPVGPAMLPIRPPEIANVFADHVNRPGLLRARPGIEDQVCAAAAGCGFTVWGRFDGGFVWAHSSPALAPVLRSIGGRGSVRLA